MTFRTLGGLLIVLVGVSVVGSAHGQAQTPAQTPTQTRPQAETLDDAEWTRREIAVLQGLDKVTARISRFEVPVGQGARFGTLNVYVDTCQERPPTFPPESAAFLRIEDQPPDETARPIFSGWMFASSPGLNALEHPVYDVWVAACRSASTPGQSSDSTSN